MQGLLYIIIAITILYIVGFALVYFWQDWFIFLPKKLPLGYSFSFKSPFDSFVLPTKDGAEIHGLWFHCERPKGVVLYFHGNADNLVRWGELSKDFLQHGYEVCMMDYRGFGLSRGKRSEAHMYADALLVYHHVRTVFSDTQIFCYGRSMGSAFGTYIAALFPIKGLILETPFYSIPALFDSYYPFTPNIFIFKYRFPNFEYLPKVHAPIWIFHGVEDTVVPYGHALRLTQLQPKNITLITLPRANHKNCPSFEAYQQALAEILG